MDKLLDLQYDWLHSKIIFYSPPTLLQLALVKSAVIIYYEEADNFLEEIETYRKVRNKIQVILIPETLRSHIALMAEIVHNQMKEFTRLLPREFSTNIGWIILREKLHWTSQGTIDKRSTAECLADMNDLDVIIRFRIALEFRLVDKINALAIKIPSKYCMKDREKFRKLVDMDDVTIAKRHFGISERVHDYKYCFKEIIRSGNELGYHYYWQHLSEQEIEDVLQPQFIRNLDGFYYYKFMLFIFTHCNIERKLQILQDENNCYILVTQLLGFQWLSFFDAFVTDALKRLTVNSVVKLLNESVKRMMPTRAYTKKYLQICSLLLQHLCKECSITSLQNCYLDMILECLHIGVEWGELQLVRIFLQSVDNEWIKKQFSDDNCSLRYFILAALKSGMIEVVFSFALLTALERKEFCNRQVFFSVMYDLFYNTEMDNVDKLLSLLDFSSEDMKSYKMKFAKEFGVEICFMPFVIGKSECLNNFVQSCFSSEKDIQSFKIKFVKENGYYLCNYLLKERKFESAEKLVHWCFPSKKQTVHSFKVKFAEKYGCELCFELLREGHWEFVIKFVRWCFASERQSFCFYRKFLKSEYFPNLFRRVYLKIKLVASPAVALDYMGDSNDIISSLNKVTHLSDHFGSKELMLDACKRILFECYANYYTDYDLNLNEGKILLEAIERFLLACTNNNQSMLTDLKQELVCIGKSGKLNISLLLDFLHKRIKSRCYNWKTEKEKDELSLWHQMIGDFFTWTCSSDENLKAELLEEFWDSDEVIVTKSALKNKTMRMAPIIPKRKRRRIN